MEPCSGQLEKAICKSVLNKGDAKVMDGYENIIVYTHKHDTWITSVIENKVSVMKWFSWLHCLLIFSIFFLTLFLYSI